jgi:hypothetical protein
VISFGREWNDRFTSPCYPLGQSTRGFTPATASHRGVMEILLFFSPSCLHYLFLHSGFLSARPMFIRLLARFFHVGVGSPIYQPPGPFPDSESLITSSSSSSW